jgi:four helix bundle protein
MTRNVGNIMSGDSRKRFVEFTELEVYQLAENLGDCVWDIVVKWYSFARNSIGVQLVRAADSIGANIAEGHGSGSPAENRRFVRYAKRSLNETRYWLRRAQKRSLLSPSQSTQLHELLNLLRPKLLAYLAAIRRQLE